MFEFIEFMSIAPLVLAAGIGAAGSLIGGAKAASGAKQVNAQQIELAREQMEFQERMSSTAHQRQVKDLKEAGLNPILSAGGSGASSPSGAMPSLQNPDAHLGKGISDASGKAMQFVQMKQNLANQAAVEDLTKAQTNSAKETARGLEIDNDLKQYEKGIKEAYYKKIFDGISWLEDKVDTIFGDVPGSGAHSAKGSIGIELPDAGKKFSFPLKVKKLSKKELQEVNMHPVDVTPKLTDPLYKEKMIRVRAYDEAKKNWSK